MSIPVVDIEKGCPTVAYALNKMSMAVRQAKAQRTPFLKVVHGWGSSGVGGSIKASLSADLRKKVREGLIQGFIKGEDLSPFVEETRKWTAKYPIIRKDADWGKQNFGVTLIII